LVELSPDIDRARIAPFLTAASAHRLRDLLDHSTSSRLVFAAIHC